MLGQIHASIETVGDLTNFDLLVRFCVWRAISVDDPPELLAVRCVLKAICLFQLLVSSSQSVCKHLDCVTCACSWAREPNYNLNAVA